MEQFFAILMGLLLDAAAVVLVLHMAFQAEHHAPGGSRTPLAMTFGFLLGCAGCWEAHASVALFLLMALGCMLSYTALVLAVPER